MRKFVAGLSVVALIGLGAGLASCGDQTDFNDMQDWASDFMNSPQVTSLTENGKNFRQDPAQAKKDPERCERFVQDMRNTAEFAPKSPFRPGEFTTALREYVVVVDNFCKGDLVKSGEANARAEKMVADYTAKAEEEFPGIQERWAKRDFATKNDGSTIFPF